MDMLERKYNIMGIEIPEFKAHMLETTLRGFGQD